MSCSTGKCETRSYSGMGFSSLLGWLLSACLLFAVSEKVNGVSLGLGENVGEEGSNNGNNDVKAMEVVGMSPLAGRVKRSRDVQQLCGYRLLDALRSVCDRNFVGFARRADPGFLIHAGGDGQSGEENSPFGNNLSNSQWESIGVEYPSFMGNGDHPSTATTTTPINYNGDGGSLLDYWELMQPPSAQSSSSPMWARNGGSTKSIALRILAEPPKTHQRFRRNIIDECCKKPCAMGQMLKYCAITGVGKRGGN